MMVCNNPGHGVPHQPFCELTVAGFFPGNTGACNWLLMKCLSRMNLSQKNISHYSLPSKV